MIARVPVKLPGPQPTAKKEISLKEIELSFRKFNCGHNNREIHY